MSGTTTGTIVLCGALAQKAGQGGLTWVYLQYLLGFHRLGWDVLFLDRLEPDMCLDAAGHPSAVETSGNLTYLRDVMAQVGLGTSWALLHDGGTRTAGLSREEVLKRVRSSVALINVMGYLDDEEVLAAAENRVFLDIDPGFGQMWHDLGLAEMFHDHDQYVTIGENIGRPDCTIPTCGIEWVTTPQPVVLDYWPAHGGNGTAYTSVATWRGPNAPVEYAGRTYGLRVHEFRKFVELPRKSGNRFEVALDIHPGEKRDLELLEANGWKLIDPQTVAHNPWTYRRYVQASRAEFMVAKGMYVESRSGWISDRTLCYLASGRPVLAQDTGIDGLYPTGEGLVTYSTLEEALAGVETIEADYERHARAAHELAVEYFDAEKVLSRLLGKLSLA